MTGQNHSRPAGQQQRKGKRKSSFSILMLLFLCIFALRIRFDDSKETTTTTFVRQQQQQQQEQSSFSRQNHNQTTKTKVISVKATNNISYFTVRRGDRSGAAIHDMIKAHAVSYQQNSKYIGACPKRTKHYTPDTAQLLKAMGWETPLPLLSQPCPYYVKQASVAKLQLGLNGLRGKGDEADADQHQRVIFTKEWRHYFLQQAGIEIQQRNQDDKAFRIAVYIRRGDVTPCRHPDRYLPNQYYLDQISKYLPKSGSTPNVTIYSQSDSFEPLHSAFSSWHVALDTDISIVWKAIIQADVAILSISSFSYVPALLRDDDMVTVYYPFWHTPLPHWTVVDDNSTEQVQRLAATGCSSGQ